MGDLVEVKAEVEVKVEIKGEVKAKAKGQGRVTHHPSFIIPYR
jgi:hypothetical protein